MTIIRSEGNVNKCLVWLAAIRAVLKIGTCLFSNCSKNSVEKSGTSRFVAALVALAYRNALALEQASASAK